MISDDTHPREPLNPPFHSGEHSSNISPEIGCASGKHGTKLSLLKHAAFTLFARENLTK